MLLPLEAAVIQEVRGEPGCHNDPRLVAPRGRTLAWSVSSARPACAVDCRKSKRSVCSSTVCGAVVWSCCVGDGLSRVDVDSSGLVHGEFFGLQSALTLLTVSIGCVFLKKFVICLLARTSTS